MKKRCPMYLSMFTFLCLPCQHIILKLGAMLEVVSQICASVWQWSPSLGFNPS